MYSSVPHGVCRCRGKTPARFRGHFWLKIVPSFRNFPPKFSKNVRKIKNVFRNFPA